MSSDSAARGTKDELSEPERVMSWISKSFPRRPRALQVLNVRKRVERQPPEAAGPALLADRSRLLVRQDAHDRLADDRLRGGADQPADLYPDSMRIRNSLAIWRFWD